MRATAATTRRSPPKNTTAFGVSAPIAIKRTAPKSYACDTQKNASDDAEDGDQTLHGIQRATRLTGWRMERCRFGIRDHSTGSGGERS
jgi:hypothetical protein